MTGTGFSLALGGYFLAVLAGSLVCGSALVLRRQAGVGPGRWGR